MNYFPKIFLISAILIWLIEPAEAREPTKPLPGTKVVVRISRQFIHELTRHHFSQDEPIIMNSFKATIQGSVHISGTFDVKLHKSASAIDFDFVTKGEILTEVMASRLRVQVHEHGVAEFNGRRHVTFDGNEFSGQSFEINAAYRSTIDQVCSFRGGLVGSLSRGIGLRTARNSLPESDQRAENEIRSRLKLSLKAETDQIISTMNKLGPLLRKGEVILREQNLLSGSSVQHYLATTEEHLYLSIGEPGHEIPSLPTLEVLKRGPIEVWIAIDKAKPDDLRTAILQHWDIAKPFVLQRIGRASPELAKFVEQVQVETTEGWYVVTIAPKLLKP